MKKFLLSFVAVLAIAFSAEAAPKQGQGNNIYFASGSAALSSSAKRALDEIAFFVNSEHGRFKRIQVMGYTDEQGAQSPNSDLSDDRAMNVKKYLQSKLRKDSRVRIKFGYAGKYFADKCYGNAGCLANDRKVTITFDY